MEIDGIEGDFIILSYHEEVFKSGSKKIANGFINAMKRYRDKIDCMDMFVLDLKNRMRSKSSKPPTKTIFLWS